MQLLATWTIPHHGVQRTIELLKGDLAYLPLEHSVDILVVSAFPNDYLPTSTSLIGALDRTGLSIAQLARKKEVDSRKEFSCWLSQLIFSGISENAAKDIFAEIQHKRPATELRQNINSAKTETENVTERYDLFISYSHQDWEFARQTIEKVTNASSNVRVFYDRKNLKRGGSWLTQVAESLDNARRVAALYTPYYWSSPSCKDEFTAALARQNDMGIPVLFPIYIMSAPIPYLFRNLHYADCREGNEAKLSDACLELSRSLLQ